MPKGIKLLSFDIVNTILKVHRSPGYQYALVASRNGIPTTAEQIDRVYREVWKEKKCEHPTYGVKHGLSSQAWWEDFVKRVFIRSGYEGDAKLLKDLATKIWYHYKTVPGCWDVLPHSVSVLQKVRTQGFRTCVVSNFDERLTETLKTLKLYHLFDFVVTCTDAKCSKPDEEIYQYALRRAGVCASEALHVGDSVQEDYWAARGVGMAAILLDKDSKLTVDQLEAIPPQHVIRDLQQLPVILNNIREFL